MRKWFKKPSQSKYKNKKTEIDGYKFASKKEAEKYLELKMLKTSGYVVDFKVHPRYLIIEGFEKDGNKYRNIYYEADFEVDYADGTNEVIDIKPYVKKTGKYFTTPVFKIKSRLFDIRYPNKTLIIE